MGRVSESCTPTATGHRAPIVSNLEEAVKHHQGGQLHEAEQIYLEILKSRPNHPDVLHLLGVIAAQRAQPGQAVDLIEKAIQIDPTVAAYHKNLGEALRAHGSLDKAIDAFRSSLAIEFDNDTLDGLAQALFAQGMAEHAVEFYLRALDRRSDDARARRGLVSLLRTVRPTGSWADLEQELCVCYRSSDIDHQHLAGVTANQLKHKYGFLDRLPLSVADNGAFLDPLSRDPLLLALLTQTVNVDFDIEQFLTDLRRDFLLTHYDGSGIPQVRVALLGALARQCFNNEYVFNCDTEEAQAVEKLKDFVCEKLVSVTESIEIDLETPLLLLACYVPLVSLRCASELQALDTQRWSPMVQGLIERTLVEPLDENAIERDIDSIGEINDATSTAVQAQYEASPYPRWFHIGRPDESTLASMFRAHFPSFTPPDFLDTNARILIAGCGTGKEAIKFALVNQNAEVIAVDLSRRSLAYAVRMARKLGVDNVRFLQGDILDIERLGEGFHVISGVGVLHHMADPMAGWRALADRLEPSGLMRVALYSECARRPITAAKAEIERRGLEPIAEDIRSFRTLILRGAFDGELADISTGREFYSLSDCRDLLFHVKEHLFTPARISEALDTLDLELIGFDLSELNVPQHVQESFRHNRDRVDFAACERIEQLYPRAFMSMYRFWCRKASRP